VLCNCRNNTSDYYVNNKRMNVKEVTSLLKSKGIDLDNNRFLILQVRAHTALACTRLISKAGP
jgi:chromosome segregation ATPase